MSDEPQDGDGSATAAAVPVAVQDQQPRNNDLVLRDGFPALLLPGGSKGPNIQDDEPLPRHSFWAMEKAIELPPTHLQSLRSDCETVFSARTRDDDQAYSAGVTYFLPCQMKPRCALESLVWSIFQKHTADLDPSIFLPEQSGAEWWTLVLNDDEDDDQQAESSKPKDSGVKNDGSGNGDDDEEESESDEVGLHFDADYGLEAQAPNLMLHPRLATVTYLSDFGSPTVVFDVASPAPNDTEKASLKGEVRTGWLSQPSIGKHMAFDGRLLHGAPSTFFPPAESKLSEESAKKKVKTDERRFTLLVNIWLNHCPVDAEPMEEDLVAQLTTAPNDDNEPMFSWNPGVDLTTSPLHTKVAVEASTSDPAGSEEVVLCSRLVTIHYNASMEDFHDLATQGNSLFLDLGKDAVSLEVGGVVEEEEESEDDS